MTKKRTTTIPMTTKFIGFEEAKKRLSITGDPLAVKNSGFISQKPNWSARGKFSKIKTKTRFYFYIFAKPLLKYRWAGKNIPLWN
jgi:hypothetical protein